VIRWQSEPAVPVKHRTAWETPGIVSEPSCSPAGFRQATCIDDGPARLITRGGPARWAKVPALLNAPQNAFDRSCTEAVDDVLVGLPHLERHELRSTARVPQRQMPHFGSPPSPKTKPAPQPGKLCALCMGGWRGRRRIVGALRLDE
jgi:hypothetical protein